MGETDQRERVLQLIQRFGWNATAFQTLETGYDYFFDTDDACVAYVDTGSAWVAAGAPLAAAESLPEAAEAFRRAAHAAGRRCCFFATEERFRDASATGWSAFVIGQQPSWDPRDWAGSLSRHPSLRQQLRRAQNKGVSVRALAPSERETEPVRRALRLVGERWLATRDMAAMSFLVRLEPFHQAEQRQCFVAEREGRLLGFAGVVPVPARGGWFLEDLVRDPSAPNGTSELLVDAVMTWAAAHGCEWLTLGLAPLAGDVGGVLKWVRKLSSPLYDFDGLRVYKAKLRPASWTNIYLSYPDSQGAIRSLLDALRAFAPQGLLRFGLQSLLRGPMVVVATLAALLAPWTVLLALAPAEHWFGNAYVKWGWVAFDLALLLGFSRWLQRPRLALLSVLALAVTADACLTLLQALLWNVRQARGLLEIALVVIACAMPALAAGILWGAQRRSRQTARAAPRL
ncbi:MAG TPA: DUF2156 domain-containing protein [Polyangiales bacterium]|nr:DUF2156 domain-containing protein [Polyangiales bacterium]